MMFGYPGAGKTTVAMSISRLTGAIHLSSDKQRLAMFNPPNFSQQEHNILYDELDRLTAQFLSSKKDVIYDANLNRLKHRNEKYNICEKIGSTPILIWVQTPRQTARNRAINVIRKPLWPKDETATQMFNRIADIIELPGPDEPVIKLDGTKITDDYIREKLTI